MTALGNFFPRRINSYVPNMHYAADVEKGGEGTVFIPDIVYPVVPSAAIPLTEKTLNKLNPVNFELPAKFGMGASLAFVGTTAGNAIVIGTDYLGQPMQENITVAATVTLVKIFKWIDSIKFTNGTVADNTTVVVTPLLAKIGLPYKAIKLIADGMNGRAMTGVSSLTAGYSDVQTVNSPDPRGSYFPKESDFSAGKNTITLTCLFDINNLHGNKHYWPAST